MPEATESVATDSLPTPEQAAAGLAMINEKLGLTEQEPVEELEQVDAAEGTDTVEGEDGGEGDGEETNAAETETETAPEDLDSAPEETPEVAAEPPEKKPVKKEPAATEQTETRKDLRAERKRINTRLTDLRAQLKAKRDAKTFDAVDDGDLLADIADAAIEAQQIQEEAIDEIDNEVVAPRQKEAAAEAYWEGWKDPDVDVETARDAWETSIASALEAVGTDAGEKEIAAVAKFAFKQKLDQIKGGKKSAAQQKAKEDEKKNGPVPKVPARNLQQQPKAGINKPPVNRGAGQVVPAGGRAAVSTRQAEPVASEELKRKFLDL